MAHIVLTGATGFIGSHAVPVLLRQGHELTALTRDTSKLPSGVSGIQCDLLQADSLSALSDMKDATVLLHLAATIPQATDDNSLEHMHLANVVSTTNLLAHLPASIAHIIYASTLDVYGSPQFLPLTEQHPLHPETPYAQSKADTEAMLTAHAASHGIRLTILRLSQVYGPGEPIIKAIPRFIQNVVCGKPPEIYGDGSDIREYLSVHDAVRAIVLAIEKAPIGAINIAGGTRVSIAEVARLIGAMGTPPLEPLYHERRTPRVDIYFDLAQARDTLGFIPTVLLEAGIQEQYDYAVRHQT